VPGSGKKTSCAARLPGEGADIEIARLAPHLKAPLILTSLEGRSQAEAAGILGISIKAVETRVARARRRLSAAFQNT